MSIASHFSKLSGIELQQNVLLAPFTTWKIGGPAEYLIEVETAVDLKRVLTIIFTHDIPFTILGKASNVLISDRGLKGLTIINRTRTIEIPDETTKLTHPSRGSKDQHGVNPYIPHRHSETGDQRFYSFDDLEFEEQSTPVQTRFDSGLELASAIAATTKKKLSGLQWFAGIPGTIGGSLYNNIHGGTRHFSDTFVSARLMIPKSSQVAQAVCNQTEGGELTSPFRAGKEVGNADSQTDISTSQFQHATIIDESQKWMEIEADFGFFGFGYDQSILRTNPEIIVLSVTMNLYPRTDDKALKVAREWLKRKRVQPKKSCGSVFQCITTEQQQKRGYPTPSAGYITDHILGLKGTRSGDVLISQRHANFIENIGANATAADVLKLIRLVKKEAHRKTGITLHPEINFLGFESGDLTDVL